MRLEARRGRGVARELDHRGRGVDAEDVVAGIGQRASEDAAAAADVDDEAFADAMRFQQAMTPADATRANSEKPA